MKKELVLSKTVKNWTGSIYKTMSTLYPYFVTIKNNETEYVDYPELDRDNNISFHNEVKVDNLGRYLSHHLCAAANHLEKIEYICEIENR